MKNLSLRIVIFLMLLIVISCHYNPLKTNEKELAKEIIIQEREKAEAEKTANEKKFADITDRSARGFRLKEDRSVDPAHPPIIIDLAGSLNNIKEINLSEVATNVTYIRIEHLPDSTLPSILKVRYYLLDNYIIAIDLYGIHQYTKGGRFIRTIVKNEYTGVDVKGGSVHFRFDYTEKGGSMSVQGIGDKLFYEYYNTNAGQKYVMEYDCSSEKIPIVYKFDPENPNKVSGLGSIVIDLNNGKSEPPKPHTLNGMFGGPLETLFSGRSLFMFDHNTYSLPLNNDNMMAVLNSTGDTLTTFSMLEKLKNYTKQMQRGSDFGCEYEHDGKLYLRPEFNDTIFRVIPPNKLLPVYVLNLGTYKASMQEGVDPDVKLTGKIIPGEWAETENFIFMTFTKDDYDCKNTRTKKTVKIYHAIFSKSDHRFSVIKGDPYDYSPEILKNNIDGGLPAWPASYMIGKNGELLIPIKGKELKDRVKTEQFKVSKAPEVKKKELEKLAGAVSNNEDILMIVK